MNILDLIFPKSCLDCKKDGQYICKSCIGKVRYKKQICIVCERASIDGVTHIKCKKKLGLDGYISLWRYEGVVRKAIIGLKYKFASEIAKELSMYTSNRLTTGEYFLPENTLLVPIPLYWYRGNWRGFNQTVEIGKLLAERMGWDFVPDLLLRKKLRKPQAELKEDDRKKNIRGVFSLNSNYQLLSTSYILFDDVSTTGSTLKEAGKILKRNGAIKVWGLTIAK